MPKSALEANFHSDTLGLGRLGHINVSHTFVTFLISILNLDFSSLIMFEIYLNPIWT